MGLLENLVVNAKQAANVVGKKTGELVDVSKLKLQAAELSGEIKKHYETLGKTVYISQKLGVDATEEVQDLIILINEKHDELDEVNEHLSKMSNKSVCSKCGASNPKTASFCSQCGEKLVQEAKQNSYCSNSACGCHTQDDYTQGQPQQSSQQEQPLQPEESQDNPQ